MTVIGAGSLAETKTAFGPSLFLRHNIARAGLATLILALSGLQLQMFAPSALAESPRDERSGSARQWSVQVDRIDFDDLPSDPALGASIYANLLEDLVKTKQFKRVLRNDDRNADDVPELLILKTTVQESTPDSETRPAVLDDMGLLGAVPGFFLRFWGRATVNRATKLGARIQLYTREDHLVLEDVVVRNVRFTADHSRATQKLAHNVAVTLKRSTLPVPAVATPPLEAGKIPRYQVATIAAAQCHQGVDADPAVVRCEVSVIIGNTTYEVLYTARGGADNLGYETDRQLLVLVGEDTITYNDMLGNSLQVPILSRTTVTPQARQ